VTVGVSAAAVNGAQQGAPIVANEMQNALGTKRNWAQKETAGREVPGGSLSGKIKPL